MRPAEQKVAELAKVLGVPYGHYVTHDTEPDLSHLPHRDGEWKGGESPTPYKVETRDGKWITTLPSGLVADHNSTYGGWVIQQIAPNGRTWISHPYGETRRTSASFIRFVDEIIEREDARRFRILVDGDPMSTNTRLADVAGMIELYREINPDAEIVAKEQEVMA